MRRARKQYLHSNVPVPRTTAYRQRKRAKCALQVISTAEQTKARAPDCGNMSENDYFCKASEETNSDILQPADNGEFAYTASANDSDSSKGDHLNEPLLPYFDHNVVPEVAYATDSEDGDHDGGETDIQEVVCADDEVTHCERMDGLEDDSDAGITSELPTILNRLTSTTVGDALLLCLALAFRHSLSWAAVVDMLNMINHLFDRKVVNASKYYFFKHMETAREKIAYHVYCPNCERYLGMKECVSDNFSEGCPCGFELDLIHEASTFFLSLNLEEQIKDLLKDQKFVQNLNYRFQRKKINERAYEDIYDGELYRNFSVPGEVLHYPYNMSYTFNTDGCPIGKSSKQTCWPIYAQINELPPRLRSKYMMLAGIYVGKKDPNMKIFMHPFVEEANQLATKGINWVLHGQEINSKIIPLCACVDSVARCKLLNMTQFNGWFGCTLCHYKGEMCSKNGLRYTLPLNGVDERTHEGILSDSTEALNNMNSIQNQKKRSVRGCKGLTPIHNLLYLDLVRGVRPDPMHSMMLGNARHHTFLLGESCAQTYYIGSDVRLSAISGRLLSIKPPSSVKRTPRSLKEMSLWKASEWRSWALFYGVVCLYGIIPDEFVIHFSMLSSALHIMLQKSITPEQLENAHILLLRYVFLYQQYFGKIAMVYNVHLLLHAKKSVEYLGPAWTHSAFGFEGANKDLLQLKKQGAPSVAREMTVKYLTFKSLPSLCERYASSSKIVEFCEHLSGMSLKTFYRVSKTVLVGGGHTEFLNPEEVDLLENFVDVHIGETLFFRKFIHDGVCFTTADYRSVKNDDSYISFNAGERGRIQKIYQFTMHGERNIFLFVRVIRVKDKPLFPDEYGRKSTIKVVNGLGDLCIIKPSQIERQCVAMFLDNGNFICDVPFGCYGDS